MRQSAGQTLAWEVAMRRLWRPCQTFLAAFVPMRVSVYINLAVVGHQTSRSDPLDKMKAKCQLRRWFNPINWVYWSERNKWGTDRERYTRDKESWELHNSNNNNDRKERPEKDRERFQVDNNLLSCLFLLMLMWLFCSFYTGEDCWVQWLVALVSCCCVFSSWGRRCSRCHCCCSFN